MFPAISKEGFASALSVPATTVEGWMQRHFALARILASF